MDYSKFTDEELKELKKNLRKKLNISFIFLAIGFISFYLSMNDIIAFDLSLLIFVICMIASMINTFYLSFAKMRPVELEIHKRAQNIRNQKIHTVVPSDCKTIVQVTGSNLYDKTGFYLKKGMMYYIWKGDNNLNFFPVSGKLDDPKNALKSVPLSDVLYFEEAGELYHETKISGGGGNKVSIPGAIVGNAVGGGAGAVLLGNKGPKQVWSRDVTHDTRSVCLTLTQLRIINFHYSNLTIFKMVIPEKDAANVSGNANPSEVRPQAISSADEILKYKNLLDAGIITQEEFDEKKKQLLNL